MTTSNIAGLFFMSGALAGAVAGAALKDPRATVNPEAVHFVEQTWCKANRGVAWIDLESDISDGDTTVRLMQVMCNDGATYLPKPGEDYLAP